MDKAAATLRARQLREELQRHNRLYYVDAAPEISDREYDALYHELETLESKFPSLITTDSPTRRVGGEPLTGFEPVIHTVPMLSLANTYDPAEIEDFDNRIRSMVAPSERVSYVVEPKIDGVAVSLRFEDGVLVVAGTRGDGVTGDDVTANIRTIRSIPMRLLAEHPPEILEVRGEVFMSRPDFADLNRIRQEAGTQVFANPRNAAAGSLKLLNPAEVATRRLDAIFYGVGETRSSEFATHAELLATLNSFGLRTPSKFWNCQSNWSKVLMAGNPALRIRRCALDSLLLSTCVCTRPARNVT